MLLTSLDSLDVSRGTALTWPSARQMFDNSFEVTFARRTKYLWRLAFTRHVRRTLMKELAGIMLGEALFRAQPRAFYPVMSHLIDRRMDAQSRMQTTLASLRRVCGLLKDEGDVRSLLTQGLSLLELSGGMRVVLSLNDVSFHEGLWQVGLIGEDDLRIYSIGFGLDDNGVLLIGNVQGPSLKDGGLERIRNATHAAHGMRPPHLLLHTIRVLAGAMGVTCVQGVDPEHHVKGKWNLRESRLGFDYRGFWAENNGAREDGGNWTLPTTTVLRPLEDVPSKRRAMYRRRYAMLDALQMTINTMGRTPHAVSLVSPSDLRADAANEARSDAGIRSNGC